MLNADCGSDCGLMVVYACYDGWWVALVYWFWVVGFLLFVLV